MLLRGVFSGNSKLVGMCEPLHDHRDWLWTFLDVEGVEPTNNVSEPPPPPRRHLAKAVLWHPKRPRQPFCGDNPDSR